MTEMIAEGDVRCGDRDHRHDQVTKMRMNLLKEI
jgi:hypothetical protein